MEMSSEEYNVATVSGKFHLDHKKNEWRWNKHLPQTRRNEAAITYAFIYLGTLGQQITSPNFQITGNVSWMQDT